MRTIVLKIGGSLLSKNENAIFDFEYMSRLKDSLLAIPDINYLLIFGGGFAATQYQDFLRENNITDHRSLDWAGLSINSHHATLGRIVIGEDAQEEVLSGKLVEEGGTIEFNNRIICAGGAVPGHSGDGVACKLAIRCKSQDIFILKNVDGVYTANPNEDKNAVRIDSMTWDEYFEVIGPREYEPKIALPVDPATARLAQSNNIRIHILGGEDLDNVANALKGLDCKSTRIG